MSIIIALAVGLLIGFALGGALAWRDVWYRAEKGYKPALQHGHLIWVRDVT